MNNGIAPINLQCIEKGIEMNNLNDMIIFENGKADYRKISDIDLCTELNNISRFRFNRHSVYQMTESEKTKISNELYYERHLSRSQIERCLAMV